MEMGKGVIIGFLVTMICFGIINVNSSYRSKKRIKAILRKAHNDTDNYRLNIVEKRITKEYQGKEIELKFRIRGNDNEIYELTKFIENKFSEYVDKGDFNDALTLQISVKDRQFILKDFIRECENTWVDYPYADIHFDMIYEKNGEDKKGYIIRYSCAKG